jgi:adenosylcobyric acid synthase
MSKAKALMIVGTTSHAGKSLVATGFCRLFRDMGYRVAPFKAQNMSNNSYVTLTGGEMGRAQVGQAEAAGVEPHVDMNPVLLKPTTDQGCQVILQGRPHVTTSARDYYRMKEIAWEAVCESYARLSSEYDIIVLEGAGSPVEINLREKDIVNMRMAQEAEAATVLVADIERGGVFASAAGTYSLMTPAERACMCGTIVNKFRGDPSLFDTGGALIEEVTGAPYLGLLPYVQDLMIDEEDGLSIEKARALAQRPSEITIAVISLPRISNLTDFALLWSIDGVAVRPVRNADELAGADLIILPGTKSTMQDLIWLKERGLAQAIIDMAEREHVPVLGICGGYQMLGASLSDPESVEGHGGVEAGLSLLPQVNTVFKRADEKITVRVEAVTNSQHPFLSEATEIVGYEIHSGISATEGVENSPHNITERQGQKIDSAEGACCQHENSFIMGTYIHGYFDRSEIALGLVNYLRRRKGLAELPIDSAQETACLVREQSYARLADALREHINLEIIQQAMGL